MSLATKTHICTESPCPIEDRELKEKLMNNLRTIYTKTPLEQFNEEVIKEFNDEFKQMFEDLSEDKELYFKKVIKDFITQKLTEHKALILGMVREKIFEDTNYDYKLWIESEKYRWHQGGRKELREEFLNNLDTI